MFNFTTQNVYNSLVISTDPKTPVKGANVIVSEDGPRPFIRIGNVRFDLDYTDGRKVLDIQKKLPTPENLAKVTFDLNDVKTLLEEEGQPNHAGNYRIALYIGLSMNSQDSFYSNDFVYKGKPLYIEFPITSNTENLTNVASKIVNIANKYMLFMTSEKLLSVTSNGTKVTFEGVNGYQIIKKAVLQKYYENPCGGCDKEGYEDIITGVPLIYTLNTSGKVVIEGEGETLDGNSKRALEDNEVGIYPALEAFGDYNWIIHNLRIPTAANTAFWSPTNTELPVVGGQYIQYIIRLCADRDGIGGEVVGQRATSVTTHVMYVNSADPNIEAFENQLKKLGTIETKADTVLSKPYNSIQDASTDSGN